MSGISVVVQLTSNMYFKQSWVCTFLAQLVGLADSWALGQRKSAGIFPILPRKEEKAFSAFPNSSIYILSDGVTRDQEDGGGLYNHMHGLGYDQPPSNAVIVGMSL